MPPNTFKFKPWKVDQMCRDAIRANGLFVMAVLDEDPMKNLFYTVGNHARGHPELLTVAGADVDQATDILVYFSVRGMSKGKLVPGDVLVDGGKFPMRLVDAPRARDVMHVAERYYNHRDFGVLQLVVPDTNGVFPGEPGCQRPYSDQTIYG